MSFHTSTATRVVTKICALGLVIASAGFGAVYAWTTGANHGILLAGLSVLFALALEGVKPLAISSALQALSNWSPVRGLCLLALGLVAVAYSLTAELTLMAGIRGDEVAKREALIDAKAKTQDRYAKAKTELEGIPFTRSVSEVQAEINRLLIKPGADGCAEINGPVSKEVCPQVASLRIEMARAERVAELEAILTAPVETKVDVRAADPGASALALYLGALGFSVKASLLTEWLALIPVLALELGSALAGVLVASVGGPRVVQAQKTGALEDQAHAQRKAEQAILDHVRANGGALGASERGLAKLIQGSKTTTRRALNNLMVAGVLTMEVAKHGTVIRLTS